MQMLHTPQIRSTSREDSFQLEDISHRGTHHIHDKHDMHSHRFANLPVTLGPTMHDTDTQTDGYFFLTQAHAKESSVGHPSSRVLPLMDEPSTHMSNSPPKSTQKDLSPARGMLLLYAHRQALLRVLAKKADSGAAGGKGPVPVGWLQEAIVACQLDLGARQMASLCAYLAEEQVLCACVRAHLHFCVVCVVGGSG